MRHPSDRISADNNSPLSPFHVCRVIMRGFHFLIVLNIKKQNLSEYNIILNSIFDKLPAQRPKPTNRKNATFNPHQKDYRFGPIRIDWMDSNIPASTLSSSSAGKEKDRGGDGMSLPSLSLFLINSVHRTRTCAIRGKWDYLWFYKSAGGCDPCISRLCETIRSAFLEPCYRRGSIGGPCCAFLDVSFRFPNVCCSCSWNNLASAYS